MLKKQTVWLLTMLSLMIVLSVYYMIPNKSDLAFINNEPTDNEQAGNDHQMTSTDEAEDGETEVSNITNVDPDELLTTIRMDLQDERSVMTSNYQEIVKSSSTSIDEKNEALDHIQSIKQTETKENILESSILAITDDYQDVLVRAEDDIVHVHVKVNELSNEEVVHIMQMVKDELGQIPVDVNFQPVEG